MQNLYQKTILKPVEFEGIGLHSGLNAKVKLLPAEEKTGISFKRTDLKDNNIIKADYKNVTSAKLCTTLTNSSNVSVSTIEHLMAAFYMTGVDNILVEIDQIEMPIMDGSSKDFVNLIKESGIKTLEAKRKFLKITKKVEFKDNKKLISIEPSTEEGLSVDFELNYANSLIGNQKNKISFNNQNLEEIYTSRTFCLYEDIEKIKNVGLAKGGSLDNAIVVKNEKILNESGLRNKNEFVNHKILDLVGDFLLSGYRIIGNVKCVQGGHNLSNLFLQEIFKDPSNYEELDVSNIEVFNKNIKITANKVAVNA
jgi:UDP-3-O-[3-hydroxymyristoyl] N-acetylglucosamine deacetylase